MPKLVLICKEQTIMWQIDNFAVKVWSKVKLNYQQN